LLLRVEAREKGPPPLRRIGAIVAQSSAAIGTRFTIVNDVFTIVIRYKDMHPGKEMPN